MTLLIAGLVLFLGVHSVRILADAWRTRTIASLGEKRWKAVYSLVAIAGLVLIVLGYGRARAAGSELVWVLPVGLRHLSFLLIWVAFVLLAAANTPDNHLRRWTRHPMALGTLIWAVAHLLVNGLFIDIVLFGSFAIWALIDYVASLRRPEALPADAVTTVPTLKGDLITLVGATVLWMLFILVLHRLLFGVSPIA